MASAGDELERVTRDVIFRHFWEKIRFPKGMNDVQPHQMAKFVDTTTGSPFFLE